MKINLFRSAGHLGWGRAVGLGGFDVLQPHGVELSHLAPQVLQGQVTLRLPELAGRQLLLQTGDVVLGNILPLPLQVLVKFQSVILIK